MTLGDVTINFPRARIIAVAPWFAFPIRVETLSELKWELKTGSEVTVFDLTEPRSIVFTEKSYPEGGME